MIRLDVASHYRKRIQLMRNSDYVNFTLTLIHNGVKTGVKSSPVYELSTNTALEEARTSIAR